MVHGLLECKCGNLIEVNGHTVECPKCGRKYLYKYRCRGTLRRGKFILIYDPTLGGNTERPNVGIDN